MVREFELSVAAVHRIVKKAGAGRVSESAASELAKILEEVGVDIAREALYFTLHAGRKTVRAKDVKAAYEKLFKFKRPYWFES